MKKTKEITVDEKKITITEMTVKEISDVLEEVATDGQKVMEGSKPISTIDLLFGAECSGIMISRCSGIPVEELNDYSPSDVRTIIDEVKSLNPFFFEMVAKLVKVQSALPQPESKS